MHLNMRLLSVLYLKISNTNIIYQVIASCVNLGYLLLVEALK